MGSTTSAFEEPATAKKWAITAIFAIGAINFLGPKHTGGIAVWLAVPTVVVVMVLIAGGAPAHCPVPSAAPSGSIAGNWASFVDMILALSGVEVAASSTGVLKLDPGATLEKPSVFFTARRAIWAVMVDVVIGTALLSVLAMCLPDAAKEHQNDMLRYMGEVFIGPRFANAGRLGLRRAAHLGGQHRHHRHGRPALCHGARRRTARHLPPAQPLWRPLGRPHHRDGSAGRGAEH